MTDQNGGQPPDGVECNWLEALSRADLQQLQEKDVTVGKVLKWKRDHDKPDRDRLQAESNEVRALCAQWASLEIVDGSLHRRKETQTHGRETITMQLVAPHEIRKQIFDELVEWGFYALSASKAIFRARTYNCNLFSPVMMIT